MADYNWTVGEEIDPIEYSDTTRVGTERGTVKAPNGNDVTYEAEIRTVTDVSYFLLPSGLTIDFVSTRRRRNTTITTYRVTGAISAPGSGSFVRGEVVSESLTGWSCHGDANECTQIREEISSRLISSETSSESFTWEATSPPLPDTPEPPTAPSAPDKAATWGTNNSTTLNVYLLRPGDEGTTFDVPPYNSDAKPAPSLSWTGLIAGVTGSGRRLFLNRTIAQGTATMTAVLTADNGVSPDGKYTVTVNFLNPVPPQLTRKAASTVFFSNIPASYSTFTLPEATGSSPITIAEQGTVPDNLTRNEREVTGKLANGRYTVTYRYSNAFGFVDFVLTIVVRDAVPITVSPSRRTSNIAFYVGRSTEFLPPIASGDVFGYSLRGNLPRASITGPTVKTNIGSHVSLKATIQISDRISGTVVVVYESPLGEGTYTSPWHRSGGEPPETPQGPTIVQPTPSVLPPVSPKFTDENVTIQVVNNVSKVYIVEDPGGDPPAFLDYSGDLDEVSINGRALTILFTSSRTAVITLEARSQRGTGANNTAVARLTLTIISSDSIRPTWLGTIPDQTFYPDILSRVQFPRYTAFPEPNSIEESGLPEMSFDKATLLDTGIIPSSGGSTGTGTRTVTLVTLDGVRVPLSYNWRIATSADPYWAASSLPEIHRTRNTSDPVIFAPCDRSYPPANYSFLEQSADTAATVPGTVFDATKIGLFGVWTTNGRYIRRLRGTRPTDSTKFAEQLVTIVVSEAVFPTIDEDKKALRKRIFSPGIEGEVNLPYINLEKLEIMPQNVPEGSVIVKNDVNKTIKLIVNTNSIVTDTMVGMIHYRTPAGQSTVTFPWETRNIAQVGWYDQVVDKVYKELSKVFVIQASPVDYGAPDTAPYSARIPDRVEFDENRLRLQAQFDDPYQGDFEVLSPDGSASQVHPVEVDTFIAPQSGEILEYDVYIGDLNRFKCTEPSGGFPPVGKFKANPLAQNISGHLYSEAENVMVGKSTRSSGRVSFSAFYETEAGQVELETTFNFRRKEAAPKFGLDIPEIIVTVGIASQGILPETIEGANDLEASIMTYSLNKAGLTTLPVGVTFTPATREWSYDGSLALVPTEEDLEYKVVDNQTRQTSVTIKFKALATKGEWSIDELPLQTITSGKAHNVDFPPDTSGIPATWIELEDFPVGTVMNQSLRRAEITTVPLTSATGKAYLVNAAGRSEKPLLIPYVVKVDPPDLP